MWENTTSSTELPRDFFVFRVGLTLLSYLISGQVPAAGVQWAQAPATQTIPAYQNSQPPTHQQIMIEIEIIRQALQRISNEKDIYKYILI